MASRGKDLLPAAAVLLTLSATHVDPASAQVRELRLENLRAYESSPEAPLTKVHQVLVLPDGGIAVRDRLDPGIPVFDENGRFRYRIGGAGAGPGEFGSLARIGLFADTIWAVDSKYRRATLFPLASPDLAITTSPAPAPDVPGKRVVGFQVLGINSARDWVTAAAVDDIANLELRWNAVPEGAQERRPLEWARNLSVQIGQDRGKLAVTNPFHRSDVVAIGPTGDDIAVVSQEFDEVGESICVVAMLQTPRERSWHIAVPCPAPPVSREQVDSWLDDLGPLHDLSRLGLFTLDAGRRAVRDELGSVRKGPGLVDGAEAGVASGAAIVESSTRVWVHTTARGWLMVGPSGLEARLDLEEDSVLHFVDGGRVWITQSDPFGVPTLYRARLAPTTGG